MSFKHITITGLPGVGKTSLIKKLVTNLQRNDIKITGFYTEEIRNETGNRIGFDVVTLDGKRGELARSSNLLKSHEITRFKVGQYVVFPNKFEELVLPLFEKEKQVMIIDEIGKMEMFSNKFKNIVQNCYKNDGTMILATIPLKTTQIQLVEDIRNNKEAKLFTVDKNIRNSIQKEIIKDILEIIKN